jgi:hypothetical protein
LKSPPACVDNSLAVQTTLQPWSAAVYHSILQQGCQPSMAFVPVPQALFALKAGAEVLEGGLQHVPDCHCNISFEEARVAVQAELLSIGYVSGASGQLHLNPEEGSRLSPGDILVALTTQANVAKAGGSCMWQLLRVFQAAALVVAHCRCLPSPNRRQAAALSPPAGLAAADGSCAARQPCRCQAADTHADEDGVGSTASTRSSSSSGCGD